MFIRKITAVVVAGLLTGAGLAQAASTFPTAGEEGGLSVNAPLPEITNAVELTIDSSTFPSAGTE